MGSFGQSSEVWVCSFAHAADLAGVLREMVVAAWHHEVAAAEQAGNAEKVKRQAKRTRAAVLGSSTRSRYA
jgi:hypothetical protein